MLSARAAGTALVAAFSFSGCGEAPWTDDSDRGAGGRSLWTDAVEARVAAGGLDALCDTILNTYRCGRRIEAYQLERAAGVRRAGDTLAIRLATGREAEFVDGSRARIFAGRAVRYAYRAYLPALRRHVLLEQFQEGGRFVLLDDSTGRRMSVYGVPAVSPAGDAFAVANADLVAEYTPNTLQVWRVERDGELSVAHDVRPDGWGAADPAWTAPDTLTFTRIVLCDGAPCEERGWRLVRSGADWRLVPP